MSFDPEKPFNDLPLLPPKAEIETPAVLKKAVAANKTLAELKGFVNVIPTNQDILINTLILNEARDGSETVKFVCDILQRDKAKGIRLHMPGLI